MLRRIKDLVRGRFNASIAEVEDGGLWQKAVLGLAVVGSDEHFVGAMLDEIIRFVEAEVDVTRVEREVQTFNDCLSSNPPHWEP